MERLRDAIIGSLTPEQGILVFNIFQSAVGAIGALTTLAVFEGALAVPLLALAARRRGRSAAWSLWSVHPVLGLWTSMLALRMATGEERRGVAPAAVAAAALFGSAAIAGVMLGLVAAWTLHPLPGDAEAAAELVVFFALPLSAALLLGARAAVVLALAWWAARESGRGVLRTLWLLIPLLRLPALLLWALAERRPGGDARFSEGAAG